MIAVLFGSNLVGGANVEKRALIAVGEAERVPGKAANAHLQDAVRKTRAKDFVTRLIGSIGRTLERRGQADLERLNKPLSLDEAWVGRWYGRSRLLQEGLLHGSLNSARTPKSEPKSWDDRLD